MSEADLPPEVLAALHTPKSEDLPTPVDEPDGTEDVVEDDDYYDRRWDKGWMSDVNPDVKRRK